MRAVGAGWKLQSFALTGGEGADGEGGKMGFSCDEEWWRIKCVRLRRIPVEQIKVPRPKGTGI